MVLTTISAVLFLVVFLADLFGFHTNPYIGIIFFLVLPGLFVIGLALIPIGTWVERRRRAAGRAPSAAHWPRIDLNDPAHRRTAVAIFALTMVNIVIVSLASYRGIEYMDSVQFCGQVCHTVMQPEFVAHQQGAHAPVKCVECHEERGATSFAKAKMAGTRRLVAVVANSYPRPIRPSGDEHVAAREACGHCHSPGEFHGDRSRRIVEYANDEKNTETATTLKVHVGGGDGRGNAVGIHWHANSGTVVEFVAAEADQQTIPYVRATGRDGVVREFYAEKVTPEAVQGSRHRMDCLDCHNRPSHQIASTPERAVDAAIAAGAIPKTLPFIRRESVAVLKATYASQDEASQEISRMLGNFYQAGRQASAAEVSQAIRGVQDIARRNVFPAMNVGFGTYLSNIGHTDSNGCFRCHDDSHTAKDGKKIGQDCELCHSIE
jgi:hypothetical protein